jgi:hypothetical protein
VISYSWTLILMLVGFVFRKMTGKTGAQLFKPTDPDFSPVFEISRPPANAPES